jgi:hypothetical protein
MKRITILSVFAVGMFVFAPLLFAQSKDPVVEAVKEIYGHQQKNLVAAAEEMPADKYGFKPTPEQITFGHLMMHIAGSNNFMCSTISGMPAPKSEELKETDSKDKLVAALKASFDFCGTALDHVDASKLGDQVNIWGGRKASRAWVLIELTGDWADHYSAAAMYLRLNGKLPPTAKKD